MQSELTAFIIGFVIGILLTMMVMADYQHVAVVRRGHAHYDPLTKALIWHPSCAPTNFFNSK